MSLDYRYQAINYSGSVIATGNKLGDVQGYGHRIIIDYKQRRFCQESMYPVIRPLWGKYDPEYISTLIK